MKEKIKVVTYNQMLATLQVMLDNGLRHGDEPFMVAGNYIQKIEDTRNGGVILCYGELEIERDVPPLRV